MYLITNQKQQQQKKTATTKSILILQLNQDLKIYRLLIEIFPRELIFIFHRVNNTQIKKLQTNTKLSGILFISYFFLLNLAFVYTNKKLLKYRIITFVRKIFQK